MSHRAVVITVSDRSAAGERVDLGGPVAVEALRQAGYTCGEAVIVPDGIDSVKNALRAALAAGARLIVTTGGTGLSERDLTPEATSRVIDRPLPGLAEELRRRGTSDTPLAVLSRGIAGTAGRALVVNLPGAVRAISAGMTVIVPVAAHAIAQIDGGDHA